MHERTLKERKKNEIDRIRGCFLEKCVSVLRECRLVVDRCCPLRNPLSLSHGPASLVVFAPAPVVLEKTVAKLRCLVALAVIVLAEMNVVAVVVVAAAAVEKVVVVAKEPAVVVVVVAAVAVVAAAAAAVAAQAKQLLVVMLGTWVAGFHGVARVAIGFHYSGVDSTMSSSSSSTPR